MREKDEQLKTTGENRTTFGWKNALQFDVICRVYTSHDNNNGKKK